MERRIADMAIDIAKLDESIARQNDKMPFSGVVLVREKGKTVFAKGYGFANRAESIPNTINTRFGMASGAKTFTAVAICQLVERELISFDTRLRDCRGISFPEFDPAITVHHLLTHSSGMPDYFDEEVMDDYEALWRDRPMYNIRTPKDFLPMFQNQKMKFAPGARWSYNNAGFVVLGLIVEQLTGESFPMYIEANILTPCDMKDTGYFAMDRLPERTAYGYIEDETGNGWKTNFYAVQIIGGGDGGAYTTASDMVKFWEALLNNRLLSKAMTERLLTPHLVTSAKGGETFYGYGVWIVKKQDAIYAYYAPGQDPGVEFLSTVYPGKEVQTTTMGNTINATWPIYDCVAAAVSAA